MKNTPRRFWNDTDGGASDWVILSAGIALLGIVTVYQVFVGAGDVVSRINEGLASHSGQVSASRPPAISERLHDECGELTTFAAKEDCEQDADSNPLPSQ